MFPAFGALFGEPIPAYFVMLILGFAVATWLGVRWAKYEKLDHEIVIDIGLFALIAGVAGGRILHVIADGYFWDYVHLCTDPSQVAWHINHAECTSVDGLWDAAKSVCRPTERDCFAWAAFWRGGLAYYGGLVTATAYCLYFLRAEKFPIWKAADMAGMTVPVGLFFGRIGCFFGGCCFGKVTDSTLSVVFPSWSAASEAQWRAHEIASPALKSLPVHPTQLYEAAGSLLVAALCFGLVYRRKHFDGQVFLTFLVLYSVLRFMLEFLRADDRGGMLGLSTSQLISVVITAIVFWVAPKIRAWNISATQPVPSETSP